jgi:ubiquinone/menaquinone biosynthesis C-methylase UbiE
MAANYDNAAWFYDSLSHLVFGKALVNAQVYLLQFIPENATILIVGGGTGWILDEITKKHPSGLQITYVEVSPKMMTLSKKRNFADNQVVFVNGAIEDVQHLPDFDVVITPFLFDNFKVETFKRVFAHINSYLNAGGIWLNCDFHLNGKWWQKLLLKSMFLFFRIVCNIEGFKLPDIGQEFIIKGYKAVASQSFFGEFIIAKAYKMR